MKQELTLSQILEPKRIRTQVDLSTKQEALAFLAELLTQDLHIAPENVLEKIWERERIMSTGIGRGFACPHAKVDTIEETRAALITLKNPIDFDALDHQPVNIILMLIGPSSAVAQHLRLLSRIARLMMTDTIRERIVQSSSEEEVWKILKEEEAKRTEVVNKTGNRN